MRNRQLILILLPAVFLLSACRPKGVLSSRQMREVMYDLHRTEGILQQVGYNYGHEEEVEKYYYTVLERHGVTQAQFDSSLVWYTEHPDFGDKLYPKVVTRLEEDLKAVEDAIAERDRVDPTELQPIRPLRPLSDLEDWRRTMREGWKPWKLDFYPLEVANPPFFEKNDEKE